MSSKIWLINLVLTVAVVFFGIKAYGVWSEGDQGPLKAGAIRKPLPWPEKKIAKKNMPPESDYEIIVSYNLFSHLRSESKPEEEKKPMPNETEPKVGGRSFKLLEWTHQRTNLYGVIIVDEHKEALIGEVPANRGKTAGEMGVKRARVGDTVGRFKVKEIKNTGVVLTAGGYEWPISLFDKDKPKKRIPVKKQTGPIVIDAGSKPGTGETSDGAKKKEASPVPATTKKPLFVKGQSMQRTVPVPDRSIPDTSRKNIETKAIPNRPGPDKR